MRGEAIMEYKGYAAGPIDFDPEDKTFSVPYFGTREITPASLAAHSLLRRFGEEAGSAQMASLCVGIDLREQ